MATGNVAGLAPAQATAGGGLTGRVTKRADRGRFEEVAHEQHRSLRRPCPDQPAHTTVYFMAHIAQSRHRDNKDKHKGKQTQTKHTDSDDGRELYGGYKEPVCKYNLKHWIWCGAWLG